MFKLKSGTTIAYTNENATGQSTYFGSGADIIVFKPFSQFTNNIRSLVIGPKTIVRLIAKNEKDNSILVDEQFKNDSDIVKSVNRKDSRVTEIKVINLVESFNVNYNSFNLVNVLVILFIIFILFLIFYKK